jgi:hypothetical protein
MTMQMHIEIRQHPVRYFELHVADAGQLGGHGHRVGAVSGWMP